MNKNFKVFDEYANTFDMNEHMIAYKYKHSYRVMDLSEEIASSLNLDEHEIYVARVIGLLHDIGRFKQWTEYKTFVDRKSIDHGDEGKKILSDKNFINKFNIDESDYDTVRTAVCNHNKYEYDISHLSSRDDMHSKIVRDADKLDILYAFSIASLLKLKEDNSEIDKDTTAFFFNHKETKFKENRTCNDRVVGLISFIYDLNYPYSINKVKKGKYLENMAEQLNNKELFKPYFDEAIKYLKERSDEYDG